MHAMLWNKKCEKNNDRFLIKSSLIFFFFINKYSLGKKFTKILEKIEKFNFYLWKE
jgi:hypothetical protein